MKKILLGLSLCLPLKHMTLNSGYGFRVHPVTRHYAFHNGIDLNARQDTVFAVLDGVVSSVGYDPVSGVYVRLDHGALQTGYGHLSQVFVLSGDTVLAGTPLGISGRSGRVTGEHLHFTVWLRGKVVSPLALLRMAMP